MPRKEPAIVVPDVRGEGLAAGSRAVEAAGASVTLSPDPDDASNCKVADQDVIGHLTSVASVTLTVRCTPPDVTGENADSAQSSLESEGFGISFNPDLGMAEPTACMVQSQDPSEDAAPGSAVAVRVSCELPDVRGQDGATAQRALEEAGFTVTLDPARSDPSVCTVKAQAPAGKATPGTNVTVTLDCPGAPWY